MKLHARKRRVKAIQRFARRSAVGGGAPALASASQKLVLTVAASQGSDPSVAATELRLLLPISAIALRALAQSDECTAQRT